MKKLRNNINSIAIFGSFGKDENDLGGQSVKSRELYGFFKEKYTGDVEIYNTDILKNRKMLVFKYIVSSMRRNNTLVLTVSSNGYRLAMPIFFILNYFYKRNIYEVVIGGTRNLFVKKHFFYRFISKHNKKIYVESLKMYNEYLAQGFSNCEYLPNFKKLNPINNIEKDRFYSTKIRVCTFSRVIREKGIEIAIKAVRQVYKEGVDIEFDIYGVIAEEYKKEFSGLELPHYINYRGVIDASKSTYVLAQYSILLFPTLYKTEGFPSTIIDAFAAGLPIICSKVGVIPEIINDGQEGFLLVDVTADELAEKILYLDKNRDVMERMAQCSLEQYKNYQTETVLSRVLEGILA